MEENEIVIYYGDTVKATRADDGVHVGGYLVRYGGLDLTGEHFEQDTDFDIDLPDRRSAYFHHGMDQTFGKRKIGRADLRNDEFGIWAETILQERDEYEQFIAELALAGKLGWSSGSVGHLVERDGSKITRWPIAEASLTHTPAEPRNGVIPLKSLSPMADKPEAGDAPAVEAPVVEQSVKLEKEVTMELEEIKTLVAEASAAAAKAAVEEYRKSEPAVAKAGVSVVTDEADQPWKSAGEFFQAVKDAAMYPGRADIRLSSRKATGLSEGVPADGGYLVDTPIAAGIWERMYGVGTLLSRFPNIPVGPNANGLVLNAVNETSRVAGSRWGGVRGYWMAEGGTKTASAPTFRQVTLKLNKVAALVYATDELLQDAVALEGWINRTVPDELRFMVEDAYIEGDGVGKPLGIMNQPSLITLARVTASQVAFADISAMWARRWAGVSDYIWIVNQDVMAQLDQLVLASSTEVPTRFMAYSENGILRMHGAPVIESEYAQSLNTSGDIMLVSPSQYLTITKGGIQSASSIHVQFLTDETVFRFVYRTDGTSPWNAALTPLHGSNTQSPFVVLGSASA